MKLGNLMKQAQQMQEGLAKAQEEVRLLRVCGESGAGLVKVHMSGAMEVLRVEIDPSMMAEGHDVIEDLLSSFYEIDLVLQETKVAACFCLSSFICDVFFHGAL